MVGAYDLQRHVSTCQTSAAGDTVFSQAEGLVRDIDAREKLNQTRVVLVMDANSSSFEQSCEAQYKGAGIQASQYGATHLAVAQPFEESTTLISLRPCFPSYWNGRLPDAIFSLAHKSDAAWNETHWKNAEFDKVLIAARAERDQAKRKQMYQDMQRMVYEQGGTIVPTFFSIIDAGQKSVGGFVPTPFAELSGYRAPERVWLES